MAVMGTGTAAGEKIKFFRPLRMAAVGILTGGAFLYAYTLGSPRVFHAVYSLKAHITSGTDWMSGSRGVALRENWTEIRLPHRGGWAVAERCRRPLDLLVFVHACAYEWQRRATLRDTIFEEAAARRFNMAGVFFVGRRSSDSDLDAWLNLEADMTGDLVVFPVEDGYYNITPKFLGGMSWVADHCPTVKWVLKIDDDVLIEPFQLQRYVGSVVTLESPSLHCSIIENGDVWRDSQTRYYVPEEDFPKDKYFRYCSGRGVIMTYAVMRDLLRAASVVPSHPIDDAYVTGNLAVAQGVGHVNIRLPFEVRPDSTDCIYRGRCWAIHLGSDYDLITGRRSLWGLLLWNHALKQMERLDLSPRLETTSYAVIFNATKADLRNAMESDGSHDY